MFPGSGGTAFYDMATLANPGVMAQIEADPEYRRQKTLAEAEIFARMPKDYSSFVQQSNVPTAAFQNVITPEDAAQYNRLQSLIGGQQITPQTLATPAAKLKEAELEKQFLEL